MIGLDRELALLHTDKFSDTTNKRTRQLEELSRVG